MNIGVAGQGPDAENHRIARAVDGRAEADGVVQLLADIARRIARLDERLSKDQIASLALFPERCQRNSIHKVVPIPMELTIGLLCFLYSTSRLINDWKERQARVDFRKF